MQRRVLDRLLLDIANAADGGDLAGALGLIGVLLEPGRGPGPAKLCLLSRLLAVELGVRDGTITRDQYDMAVMRIAGHLVGAIGAAA